MRDYDPTTGRYIQADPLGLVDGASVYGYALQNPGRYTDPRGEFVMFLPILAGLVAGEIAEYLYDKYCTCDVDSNHALERWASLGASTELIGPTHKKRKRPFRGSRRHSALSWIVGETNLPTKQKSKIRRTSRAIAKRIPYAGAAMFIYDGYRIFDCIAARAET